MSLTTHKWIKLNWLKPVSLATSDEFKKLGAEWHNQQQQLPTDVEAHKNKLPNLEHKWQH